MGASGIGPSWQAGAVTPDEIDALATRFFDAIEAGDLAAFESCYSDDAVIWHNYDRRRHKKALNVAVLGWLVAQVSDLHYEDVRRTILPDGFVQQHVLRGTAPNDAPLDVPAMMRVWCADGCITRIDEYLDSLHLLVLRAD
jgi:ketosteroid isomerase-like protein